MTVTDQHVLVVARDPQFASSMATWLGQAGYATSVAASAGQALVLARERERPHLILLDVILPDLHGLDLCTLLREQDFTGGVIMMKSHATELDRVAGLDAGADDYVSRPLALDDLRARIGSVLRRAGQGEPAVLATPSGLEVDRVTGVATFHGCPLHLGHRQLEVLLRLVERHGQVVSRPDLTSTAPSSKALDVTIARLRLSLAGAGVPDRIVNVRGRGYVLREDDSLTITRSRVEAIILDTV